MVKSYSTAGFSLVELIVSIALIAILATLALPNIMAVRGNALFAKDKRNAQTVAALAASVRAAGYTNEWADVDALIDDLEDGITVMNREHANEFSITPFSEEERAALSTYLSVSNARVIYAP